MKLSGRYIDLRLVEADDAAFIVAQRSRPEVARFLNPTVPTIDAQREWIERYKAREQAGTELYLIMLDKRTDQPCGTIRLYDYQGSSFCWGSWIVRPEAPRKAAIESVVLLYDYAFGALGFTQTHFDVRLDNERVLAFHQRMGTQRVREDEQNAYFILTKEMYEQTKPRF